MSQLFAYSLVSAIALIMLYLPYKLFMSKDNRPDMNRGIICVIYLTTLILPLAIKVISKTSVTAGANVEIGELHVTIAETAPVTDTPDIMAILIIMYITGAILLSCYIFYSLARIGSILGNTSKRNIDGTTVDVTADTRIAPFSIWGRIVVSEADLDSDIGLIIAHERIHVARHHHFDLLLANITLILQWYNPAAWLMLKELRNVHEYQADKGAIAVATSLKEYQLMLIRKAVGVRFHSLANSLNHSNLKTRITMMYSKKPTGLRRLTPLVLVPALVAAVYVTATPAVASVIRNAESTALTDDKSNKNQSSGQTTGDKIEVVAYEGTIEYASSKPEGKVYDEPETSPQYPGGIEAMMKKLSEVLKYPEEAMNENRQGRVVVRFIVDRTGKVCDPTIAQSVSPDLDRAAIDAVMQLDNFTPGTVEGKPVNVYFALPVMFSLREEKNQKAS
ncbi:MAG: M56 family metallopeptidase [Muribaculum sp.]|nr:M56 family metallopeptidase [Muribaculum sp.]